MSDILYNINTNLSGFTHDFFHSTRKCRKFQPSCVSPGNIKYNILSHQYDFFLNCLKFSKSKIFL